MARPERLEEAEIAARLAERPGWERRDDRIERRFRFADFQAAFAFMTAGALAAERLDHHPDWRNSWNTVEVRLSTHDPKGLTELDFALAEALDRAAAALGSR